MAQSPVERRAVSGKRLVAIGRPVEELKSAPPATPRERSRFVSASGTGTLNQSGSGPRGWRLYPDQELMEIEGIRREMSEQQS